MARGPAYVLRRWRGSDLAYRLSLAAEGMMERCKAPLGRVNTGFKATSRPSNVGQVVAFRAFTPAADSKGYAPNRPEVAPLGGSRRMGGPREGLGGTPRLAAPTRMVGGASLDTPEQLDHRPANHLAGQGEQPVSVHPLAALQKRAARKAVSHALAKGLMRAAEGPLMGRAYARTAHRCGEILDQSEGSLRTYWCGHRWCATCGAIRTARAWAAYGPTVAQWQGAQLVTLTVPNVKAAGLRQTVRDMHHTFATLTRALRRRFGKDAVQMIRSTEVTYNNDPTKPAFDTYHPHLHLLVHGAEVAEAVRDAWLDRCPTARRIGQDVTPADKRGMAEVFKYATKLATGDGKVVPLPALDTIYTALRGLRLWQPVGITALTDEAAGDDTAAMDQTQGTPAVSRPTEEVVWTWQQAVRDWVDGATGECLTGYTPTPRREAFLATLESMPATLGTGTAQPARQSAAYPAAPHPADTSRYLGNKGTCYVHRTSSHLMAACLGDLGAPLPARVARPAVTPAATRSDNHLTTSSMRPPRHAQKDTTPQQPPPLISSAA